MTNYAFARFFSIYLIAKRVPIVSAIPRGRQIRTFCTRPAIMNITKEIAATMMA